MIYFVREYEERCEVVVSAIGQRNSCNVCGEGGGRYVFIFYLGGWLSFLAKSREFFFSIIKS